MEFGRPTILGLSQDGGSSLITTSMEMDMAEAAAVEDQGETWKDGMGKELREALPALLNGSGPVAIKPEQMPVVVRNYVDSLVEKKQLFNVTNIVAEMRMVKSSEELQLARHAAQVAMAMMTAGYETIGDGIPKYVVALAISASETRRSAELLDEFYED